MPIREFTDQKGIAWRVWSTVPPADSPLHRYYPEGWLTFDCGSGTLRRMSPVPEGWELVSDDRLDLMCRVAEEVPRHTGEMLRIPRPPGFPPPPAEAEPGRLPGDDASAGGDVDSRRA